MPYQEKYTIAEINLNHLRYNYHKISERVAPAKVMAVVKANAYGHGAIPVARCLNDEGVHLFGVARLSEAFELHYAGIKGEILIFGGLFPDEMELAVNNGFALTITRPDDIETIQKYAAGSGKPATVHIKVDTGMGRVGLFIQSALSLVKYACQQSHLFVEGLYTHFATSDTKDKSYAIQQLQSFNRLIDDLRAEGIRIPLIHAANSGAILDLPEAYFDLVRPGIALYGHFPSTETTASLALRQVMTLKTHIAQIRSVPAGCNISYGRRYTTTRATNIAVLPIGYADGLMRAFTNKGRVLIRNKTYPLVGTITMDQTMVDLGDDKFLTGEPVIFWGDTPSGSLQATKVASEIGTIAYELCCAVSNRVPRIYLNT